MFKKKVKKVKTNRAQANAQACKQTNREDKMTIQPFKNRSEKELFEKELKDMILTPTSEHRKITKWQSATNRVHSIRIVSKQLQPNGDVFVQYLKTYNYFNSDGTKKLPKLRHKNKYNNNNN